MESELSVVCTSIEGSGSTYIRVGVATPPSLHTHTGLTTRKWVSRVWIWNPHRRSWRLVRSPSLGYSDKGVGRVSDCRECHVCHECRVSRKSRKNTL